MVSVFQHEYRPATLKNMNEARQALCRILKQRGVEESLSQKVQLCFSEACANLIKHTEPKPCFISFNLEYKTGAWNLHIHDDSKSWDPTLPKRVQSLDTFEEEKQGGRGLALMQSLSDEMHYYVQETGNQNQLTLTWHIKKPIQKPCVLIVDDDECQRRLYSAYLNEHYNLLEADSGQSALDILKTQRVELVISDIRMPGMDGLSLKKALHMDTDNLLTPFIFLTFDDNLEIREDAQDLGVDDYIIKPVTKTLLYQSAQRVLKRTEQIYRQLTDRVNKRITNTLTPSLPKKAYGWEMAVASQNTGLGGGDLVLYKEGDSSFMLNLVDVMGHDVAAKFFSYAYAGYLRGLMHHIDENNNPTASLLGLLSDSALQDGLLSQVILTCCSLILKPEGALEIASAGHPSPYLISENGIRKLDIGGVLPGVLYGAQYQSMQIRIAKGERLAIYTDGLIEAAKDDRARQDLEREIVLSLHATLALPLEEATQKVMETFDKFGMKNKDDVTLVLIQRENKSNS